MLLICDGIALLHWAQPMEIYRYMIRQNWNFFEDSEAGLGTPLIVGADKSGCMLYIQVYSANATFAGKFQAKIYEDGNWEDISAFNCDSLDMQPEFTADGIYMIDLGAYRDIRVNVSALTVIDRDHEFLVTVKGKIV